MKELFKLLSCVLISGAFMFSCTELDVDLSDELREDVITDDPEGEGGSTPASGATVASSYNTILSSGTANHGGFFSIQAVSSDEAAIPAKGGDWFDGGIWIDMHRHEWTVTSGPVNGTWTAQYDAIGECNSYLDDATDAEGIAQVRALRAYYYYRLLDLYGRVKIITSAGDNNDAEQSDRKQVFEWVEDELLAVIGDGNLPTVANPERFTESSAQALLAKLYLNAEVYTGTAKWQEASNAADEVINSGLYSLYTGDYTDIFSATNSGNSEHILAAPFDQPSGKNGMNFAQMTLHYGSQATFNLAQQPWNGYTTLEDFYNSYEDGDERKTNNFVMGPQFESDGKTPIMDLAAEGAADPDGFQLNFTPEINELFPNAIRQGGARLFKFNFEDGAQPDMNNDYPILRYSDILLIKAEATARLAGNNFGNATTLSLVNEIRDRAGASMYSSLTEDEFLAERGREMFMEATRRQDLIRFGKWDDVWWEKPESATFRNVFPIPQEQIQASETSMFQLTQNDGY